MAIPRAGADVKIPAVISSHMVLQRDMPVPIWGTAAPDESVTVTFRDQKKTAVTDNTGKWMVKLDPMKVGEPGILSIEGKNKIILGDVVVGEVWLGSGQSNMAMLTESYIANDAPLAKLSGTAVPDIRMASAKSPWQQASPEKMRNFSAMMIAFAVPLQKELGVPVGVLVGAVGGTPSGYWVTQEMLDKDEAFKAAVIAADKKQPIEDRKKAWDAEMAKYNAELARLKAIEEKSATTQPTAMRASAKLRRPPEPLPPGKSHGAIGHLFEAHIRPLMPYAIRGVLWDQGEGGTALETIDQYTAMGALIKGWRSAWQQGDFPFIYIQKPSGEGSTLEEVTAATRPSKAFTLPATPPADSAYRENHIRIMDYPGTAMVISSDLGGGTHPKSKSSYGARAAKVALGFAYGKPVEYYGPQYESHAAEGGKIRVKFKHVGKGLVSAGDKVQGFAIAGDDKVFYWAIGEIDGDTVVLSSDKVAKPVHVRYAWSQRITWATLFNKDGFPAISFSTLR